MLSTERQDFDAQVRVLCAGYDVPATSERIEAYWRGLHRMQLGSFTRVVDFALGEEGGERRSDGKAKIPAPPKLWEIHRKLRSDQRDRERPAQARIELGTCHAYANRALRWWLWHRGAASAVVLQRILAEKKRICDAYDLITTEEPEASLELRDALFAAWEKLWAPMPPEELTAGVERFRRVGHL